MRPHILFAFFLLLLQKPNCLWGQVNPFYQTDLTSGVHGLWLGPEALAETAFDWDAQWIWMDMDVASDVMLARRSFILEEKPAQARLRISASFQYQLYINGEYICRGPARSAPHHQSFDLLDITSSLREGKNSLAVRVHFLRGKFSYHHRGRAGLLAQLDLRIDGEESSIFTDQNWKVHPDPSWSNDAPAISRFQLFVNDLVDKRQALTGWESIAHEDHSWASATPLMRHVGWPGPPKNARAQALTPPWTALVPRDIPYLHSEIIEAEHVLAMSTVELGQDQVSIDEDVKQELSSKWNRVQKQKQPFLLQPSQQDQTSFLLVDFGTVHNGIPMLDIQGPAGTEIEVLCAPFIVQNQFSHKVVDSEFRDHIILSGRRDQWEATYFKPTRYLALRVHGNQKEIKLFDIKLRTLAYPFDRQGYIRSKDLSWVEAYMDATAKTIIACTSDALTDNYRERRQYAQTGYYGAMGNEWIFGDHALQRRYLIQVAQEQQANGIMPAYAPLAKDDFMIILDSNCLWIRSLRNYLLYSGDRQTSQELLPAARKLMKLLSTYSHAEGFLYNPPYAYWMDHAINDRRGANLCLNGHYLGALEDFAEVLKWLGESDHEQFSQAAMQLRESIQSHFWNEEIGLFVDAWIEGQQSEQVSEHGNAMALAMRIATVDQAQRIVTKLLEDDPLDYIRRSSGMVMVTPAMSYFLHKGLCEYGYVYESLALFRKRFDKMLDKDTNGTLWEEWWLDHTGRSGKRVPKSRSDAQTESAFPPALFGEYLLGIEPIRPGWEEVSLSCHPSQFQHLEAKIPSPLGNLLVSWEVTPNRSGEVVLDVPDAMTVQVDVATFQERSPAAVRIDGKKLPTDMQEKTYSLSAGKHRIQF